jgi:dTDP-4-dehydrorhamnose reductase
MTGPVLLLGATGQVGTELTKAFSDHALVALDRKGTDLSQPESLRAVVSDARPWLILNAGAYTAVDRAETEPELADRVNHQAVKVLAEEAQRAGALLVHYSTDYVFDGAKSSPWVEADTPAPLNVYGKTKLAGERAIAAACERYLILRTSWVYGPHGNNFFRTMLRLGRERDLLRVVDDQFGAPTSSIALAQATRAVVDRIVDCIEQEESAAQDAWAGIYHATCREHTSWFGFAQAIFAAAAADGTYTAPRLEAIASESYATPAKRPRNSALDCRKLEDRFGVRLPRWQDALEAVMRSSRDREEL